MLADLHQRLRDRLRVLAQPRALAAAKNDHGHFVLSHRLDPSPATRRVVHDDPTDPDLINTEDVDMHRIESLGLTRYRRPDRGNPGRSRLPMNQFGGRL